jgi:hypothetical protein
VLAVEQLTVAVEALREALGPAMDEDWSVPAGSLEWSVSQTVDHVVDALVWYAALVASSASTAVALDAKPPAGVSHDQRLQALTAAACILRDVLAAAPSSRRVWHSSGMSNSAGFLAMALDETLVHGHDIATGLDLSWEPDRGVAADVLARLFPGVEVGDDPWTTLVWANGRISLPDRPRRQSWVWDHSVALAEDQTSNG